MTIQQPGTGTLADHLGRLARRVDELARRNGASGAGRTWTALTMMNGWTTAAGYRPPGLTRMADGTVRCRGAITGGTATDGTQIATVPAAFCPVADVQVGVGQARIIIQPNGTALIYGIVGSIVGLDGATYTTD